MTLQTLALLTVAGLLGPARGAAAAAAYVALGLLGVPVLADWGTLPPAELLESRTVGYLVGFLPAAALAGRARGHPLAVGLTYLAAHAVILALGGSWLATHIGAGPALEHGVEPFLLGAAAKSVCAAAIVARLRGGAPMS